MRSFDTVLPGVVFCGLVAACVSESGEPPVMRASGTFEVRITPQEADNPEARAANITRLSMSKQYHGPLEATSQGELLAVGDGTTSGVYVAIEKVTGTLNGREGSFVLVHSAMLRRGTPEGRWGAVVPDSGTGQLAGIEGTLTITIVDGKHYYDLTYTLPEGRGAGGEES